MAGMTVVMRAGMAGVSTFRGMRMRAHCDYFTRFAGDTKNSCGVIGQFDTGWL
jgi:hypothetical protein